MKSMPMSGKLAVTVAFSPAAPAKQGMLTINVTVKSATGKPVKGRDRQSRCQYADDVDDRTRRCRTRSWQRSLCRESKSQCCTQWTFNVAATAGGSKGATQLKADVE
jgi:hypothetical protein